MPRQTLSRWRGPDRRMPLGRPRPEPRGEALEEGGGERDLGNEDQHLPALGERRGDRLEIDLGLARARDAVEKRHREAVGGGSRAQGRGRGLLLAGEHRDGKGRIRRRCGRSCRHGNLDQRARVDEAPHHARPDPGGRGETRLRPGQAVGEKIKDAPPRRGHRLRRRPIQPNAGNRRRRKQRARRPEHHAEHHAARGHRVVRDPIDEGADFPGQGRRVEAADDRAQPVVADRFVGRVVPDHADDVAGAERDLDDVAGRDGKPGGDPICIGSGNRDRHEHGNRALDQNGASHHDGVRPRFGPTYT